MELTVEITKHLITKTTAYNICAIVSLMSLNAIKGDFFLPSVDKEIVFHCNVDNLSLMMVSSIE